MNKVMRLVGIFNNLYRLLLFGRVNAGIVVNCPSAYKLHASTGAQYFCGW
jgi:hypothetical protein